MDLKEENVRLNADIPASLKRRLKVYCAIEGTDIKDVVIMAIESFLDEMEGAKT